MDDPIPLLRIALSDWNSTHKHAGVNRPVLAGLPCGSFRARGGPGVRRARALGLLLGSRRGVVGFEVGLRHFEERDPLLIEDEVLLLSLAPGLSHQVFLGDYSPGLLLYLPLGPDYHLDGVFRRARVPVTVYHPDAGAPAQGHPGDAGSKDAIDDVESRIVCHGHFVSAPDVALLLAGMSVEVDHRYLVGTEDLQRPVSRSRLAKFRLDGTDEVGPGQSPGVQFDRLSVPTGRRELDREGLLLT